MQTPERLSPAAGPAIPIRHLRAASKTRLLGGRAFEAAWAQAGAPRVEAISVAGQQHGMVATDEQGTPVRPAKLWNDTETAPDVGWLIKKLGGPEAWAEAVGSVPVPALTITKLSWLHRSEADAWARMRHVCLPHDWLTWKLSGQLVTDRGDASGTGYWSPLEERYRYDLLEIVDAGLDWKAMLPAVLGPSDPAGEWTDGDGRPKVACGTGDNMAAALGTGLGAGEISMSLGTSGTAYAVSDRATSDPTGAVAGFADATGKFLPLVCTLNATKVTDAVARLLGVDDDRLGVLALDAPAGAGGVAVLPWFDGERTPNRPDATGMITGLRSDVTREQIARAAFEGVVCGLLDGIDALDAAGVPVEGARHRARWGWRALARVQTHRRRPVGHDRRRSRRRRACGKGRVRAGRRAPPRGRSCRRRARLEGDTGS